MILVNATAPAIVDKVAGVFRVPCAKGHQAAVRFYFVTSMPPDNDHRLSLHACMPGISSSPVRVMYDQQNNKT